jgi:DNA helicase-2/ATP-dependent DNA helicase PcrA
MQASGYVEDLKQKGTEEADNRLANIAELYNAVLQFQAENEETKLTDFLANASLASDLDDLQEAEEKVALLTFHSAKGLEFPVVFLVGMEQGTCPHSRSLNNPLDLEEERRLCYVGVTRAKEQLFLTYARERYVWGSLETKIPSQFLQELPPDLIRSNVKSSPRQTPAPKPPSRSDSATASTTTTPQLPWAVGDRIIHDHFGEGTITHILGSGRKTNLAIKFQGIGQKIIDPKFTPIKIKSLKNQNH